MRGAIAVAGLLLIGLWVAMAWPKPANAPPVSAARGPDHGVAALATGRLGAMPADDGEAPLALARDGGAIEPRFSLRVQAVDAFGASVPEASITLRRAGAVEPFAVQVADANGLWSGPVPEGRIVVAAAAECVGSSVAFEVTAARAELGTVVLLLGRPVVVTGLVVDDGGGGIANDRIEIHGPSQSPSGQAQWLSAREVRTDAAGRFVVETMAGVRLRFARKAAPADTVWVTAVDGANAVIAPFGTFRAQVRVRAPNGDLVSADLSRTPERGRGPGLRVPDRDQPDSSVAVAEVAPGELCVQIPGSVSVERWLLADGFAPQRIHFPALTWPNTVHHLEVRMTPLVSTWLRIDRRGLPLPSTPKGEEPGYAFVSWWSASPPLPDSAPIPLRSRSIAIDDDEPVEVDLPAGSEWLACVGDGMPVRFRAGDRDVVLAPNRSLARPRIDLEVFRQDGALLTEPVLRIRRDRPARMFEEEEDQGQVRVTVVDHPAAGFTFEGGCGAIVVTDRASRQVAVAALSRDSPERMRVVLQPPAELVVHVRCGPRPARGVEVHVTSHGESTSQQVDADGRAVLQATPGQARLQVRRGLEVLVERTVQLSSGRSELELSVAL
jgi:hypothetical protein